MNEPSSRRSSRRSSQGSDEQPKSEHPARWSVVDASTTPSDILAKELNQTTQTNLIRQLDFVDVGEDTIRVLFYSSAQPSALLPPLSRCRTAQQIRYFVCMGQKQQKSVIETESNHFIVRDGRSTYEQYIQSMKQAESADSPQEAPAMDNDEIPISVSPKVFSEIQRCGGITMDLLHNLRQGGQER